VAAAQLPQLDSAPMSQVITDPLTSRSKGYGFVRFGSEAERDRALGEMSGHFISNRPIRVSLATAKKSSSLQVWLACAVQHLKPSQSEWLSRHHDMGVKRLARWGLLG
jgi:RNA recognition motif-containing protein